MLISNYEDAAFRNKRLEKCLRIWMTIMGVTREQADRLIYSLHDHKGVLHVLWNDEPTERQKMAFVDAWNECCEYVVHHSTDLSEQPYAVA
jgi:hypothetical protein